MRYKATVAYDGKNYCGWQIQPNGISVQETIEEVLYQMHKEKVFIVGSGRTDAGVSALGQVFHFDSNLNIPLEKWPLALNSLLPKDIRIIKVEKVDNNFHARYDVKWKRYRYTINMGDYDVLNKDHEYEYNKRLDVFSMRKAAAYLIGTHDFKAFNANTLKEKPNQTRTLYEVNIRERKGKLYITYTGDGFMRYMVRMMSQALIEVGKNKMKPEHIKYLLEKGTKTSISCNAVPQGLCLLEVSYEKYEKSFTQD